MSSAVAVDALAWDVVDEAYGRHVTPDMEDRWLLTQTIATGPSRRALLAGLGAGPGAHVLDVGTGFGPIPLELAGMEAVRAVGVDRNTHHLGIARALADELRGAGWIKPSSSIDFVEGDAYALPAERGEFDLVTCRLLFQHLDRPAGAADELFRVLKPGGTACVIDIDDALSVTYPEPSEAFLRLQAAFRELQELRGGDRYVGRKVSTYLEDAGFSVVAVVLLPQTAHGPSTPTDPARQFALERLRTNRQGAIDAGVIGAAEFDACFREYADEVVERQCFVEAHLAVVGRKA